ncbi:MAG: hypothetical protein M1832_005968 [Thelocarpon impressellum]|nr:MAG: hypothetical protein M1832_005968 [Thelocarpon impressellum]
MDSPLPPDPYDVLGVSKDATAAAIKTAYRKLILQTHPDKVQDESLRAQKQDEFQRIQHAYETLSDESKRREYEDQVKLAKLRKSSLGEAVRGGFRFEVRTAGFEVRTAAPPRDFDRVYEQRRAARSFDDDIGYFVDRSSARKHDGYGAARRTSHDERRTYTAEEERDRAKSYQERQRATDRGYHSERRRTRERERRRDTDEKYARAAYVEEEEDSDRHRHKSSTEDAPRRRRKDDESRREARLSEDSARRDSARRRHDDDLKLHNAREYMDRSTRSVIDDTPTRPAAAHRAATSYFVRPAPTPPSPVEDTVRRSHARRSGDRERNRGGDKHRPSRRDPSREAITIIEPPEDGARAKAMPSLPHSTSSPSALRAAAHPHPRRSETMEFSRSSREPPPLPRSSTMPINGHSRREGREARSSKLKTSAEPFDSGYESPGTPETPSGMRPSTSPRRRDVDYIEVEEREAPYVAREGRHHEAYVEGSEDDSDDGALARSVSPRRRVHSEATRPVLFREVPGGGRFSAGRSPSYTYVAEPPSRSSPAHRHAEPSPTPRGSPHLRTGSSFTRAPSFSRAESARGVMYGEVQFTPKYGREDIVYTESRRGSDGLAYRDPAPHHSSSHYAHGPHVFLRAEASR